MIVMFMSLIVGLMIFKVMKAPSPAFNGSDLTKRISGTWKLANSWMRYLMELGLYSGLMTLCSQWRQRKDRLIDRFLCCGYKCFIVSGWLAGCAKRCLIVVTESNQKLKTIRKLI